MKTTVQLLVLLLMAVGIPVHAWAHVGSKDVFEQVNAGPYKLFVTVRMPTVIPGVATIEARVSGPEVSAIRITPIPLTGEASKHPPAQDAMKVSPVDPAFYTGSLWLMASGSWQVRFDVEGAGGTASAGVPVSAIPLAILPMERSLGIVLGLLGIVLAVGMAGIVGAAVREARLPPGVSAPLNRRRRALIASVTTLAVVGAMVYLGDTWWKAEAAGYAADIYRPLELQAALTGNVLDLRFGEHITKRKREQALYKDNLLLDHGHLMHLYAIREPEMDAVFHLHPEPVADRHLRLSLPTMPPGEYKLYGDIVHASGFPETLTATLTVPAGLPGSPLGPEDASAQPPALSKGELGASYKLPDGYSMVWDRPAELMANKAYAFRFRLLGPDGKPAQDMQPYLGMAGHAAFVKTDGTTFAHTHPDGSAAMPAVMLANGEQDMAGMEMSSDPIAPVVDFPYGFPSAGRYRIFIQMKHGRVVETGVFDADVH